MGELSAKYKLSKDGEVISVSYTNGLPGSENIKDVKKGTEANNKNLKESFMSKSKKDFFDFEEALFNSLTDTEEVSYTSTPSYRVEFNSIFHEDIYASEMEMLSGINQSDLFTEDVLSIAGQKLLSVFEFIAESSLEILAAEAIFAANELLLESRNYNETGVEESFHHSFGSWGTIDVVYLSKFLFRNCNYPNNKTRYFFDITDRLSAFIVGFEAFINTERIIDYEKAFKNSEQNRVNREIGDTYGIINADSVLNISGLIGSSIHYLADSVASLTTSGMKQFYLLKRKFEHEKHWFTKELHRAKKDKDGNELENNFDLYLARLSLYRFKFIAERMNLGLKIIRYYSQSATYDSHKTLENGLNRVGLSKSGAKDKKFLIESGKKDNFAYRWKNENSGNERSQSTRIRSLPQALMLSKDFITRQMYSSNNTEHLPSTSIMQNFAVGNKNHINRLDENLVREIEKHLDNEYMPFYFHDLRTNEIISFHAFLDNISDSFSAEYTPHIGFGRSDEIKHYNKTTRSINFGFTIAATSKEDHDLMWFQINKIVAMCYPQWTRGTLKKTGDLDTIPFSQMPASSPMIRLRIGDVIKSNYSEKSYSRIENINHNSEIFSENDAVSLTINQNKKIRNYSESGLLIPGLYRAIPEGGEMLFGIGNNSNKYFHVKTYTKIEKVDKEEKEICVLVLDKEEEKYKGFKIIADKNSIINNSSIAINATKKSNKQNRSKLNKEKNPFTRSFSTSSGKGLAGFITSLGVEYNEMPWETAHKGSKAPTIVKLTIAYSPIHDISLGLDHTGMLRAPAYNVGRLNQYLFGEPTENEEIDRKMSDQGQNSDN